MNKKLNFFVIVFVVCLVSFSSVHFVSAEDGSVFENIFKNFLSAIFPLEEPQLAPLAVNDCADGVLVLGQCDLDGACDSGWTSATVDPSFPCPSGTCCRLLNSCGDGLVDALEECDGANLNSQTCISQGFDVGTLTCSSCSFNTSGCMYEVVMKGNNYLNDTYASYDGTGADLLHSSEPFLGVKSQYYSSLILPSSTIVMKWYFPSIPGAIVKEAIMNLTLVTSSGVGIYNTSVHALGGNNVINQVSGYNASSILPWIPVPAGTTVNDVPMGLANIYPAVDYVLVDNTLNSVKRYNITKLVKDWNNGVYPNRGLLIRGYNEDGYRQFASKEFESFNPAYVPTLTLRYIQCADGDGDGYNITGGECGVIDCDDTNMSIWKLYNLYLDGDNDLYGQNLPGVVGSLCGNDTLPSNSYLNSVDRALVNGDCNDNNNNINPGELEMCDNVDQDCDSTPDDGLVCECYTFFDCDDTNTCTTNLCNQVAGVGSSCSFVTLPDATSCDDGLFCTTSDQCNSGNCNGVSIDVDDSIPCTVDSCNETIDVIENIPDNSLCSNSLACDGSETCDVSSGCLPGTPVDCSGNNILGVATCSNVPDGIDTTWDYRSAFTSVCQNPIGACSIGSSVVTSSCNMSTGCGAECDINNPCVPTDCGGPDRCIVYDYYDYSDDVVNDCLADCICEANICADPIITYNDPSCITSSCTDNVWNGDETGIDCGGSCPNSCVIPCADNTDPLTCNADLTCDWCYECENNVGPVSLVGTPSCVDAIEGCGVYTCDAGVTCSIQAQCSVGDVSNVLSCVNNMTQLNETLNCNTLTCADETVSSETSACGVGEVCVDGFGCVSDGLDYITYPVNNAGWRPFAIPLVNLTNNDSSLLNADVLLTYDNSLGRWLMNYMNVQQIVELEPAKGYLAYYSSPRNISLVGNLDNTYRYDNLANDWNLIGVMDSGYTIGTIYGDSSYTAYGWDVNSNLVDVTANTLTIGKSYWVYPGTPLYAPPSFNLWDAVLRLFGFR